jgi:hypothetical protein
MHDGDAAAAAGAAAAGARAAASAAGAARDIRCRRKKILTSNRSVNSNSLSAEIARGTLSLKTFDNLNIFIY